MGWMIDQSWGYVDPQAARAAGVDIVSMYLSYDPTKNATRAKIDAYHAAGISVLLNWEASAGDALRGASVGAQHATEACRQAAALGAPPGVGIVYSCDTDATPDRVLPYYTAVSQITRANGYRPGAYGGAAILEPLSAAHLIDIVWHANAVSWDHGLAAPSAQIDQRLDHPIHIAGSADSSFDANVVVRPIPGLWTPTGVSGGDTPVTPQEIQAVADAVNAVVGNRIIGTLQTNLKDATATLQTNLKDMNSAILATITSGNVDVNALAAALHATLGPQLTADIAAALHNLTLKAI